jgi:hypothetical protein
VLVLVLVLVLGCSATDAWVAGAAAPAQPAITNQTMHAALTSDSIV